MSADLTDGQKAAIRRLVEEGVSGHDHRQTDLTDSQKAVIRQLVSDCIASHDRHQIEHIARETIGAEEDERGWLRRTHLDGGIDTGDERPIPTKQKVDVLADGVVNRWAERQPRWYDFRRRFEGAGAMAIVLLAVGGLLYEVWAGEEDDLRALFHRVAKTEAEIDARVTTTRSTWLTSDTFSDATGRALSQYATATPTPENPVRKFIHDTLEANPVLVFHGQQVIRDKASIYMRNEECIPFVMGLVSLLTKDRKSDVPGAEPSDFPEAINPARAPLVCANDVVLAGERSLDVPFFARFRETQDGLAGDKVTVILHIDGTGKDARGDAVDLAKPDKPPRGPRGVCVTYRTTDVNQDVMSDGLFIGDLLESAGNGFWSGDITARVAQTLSDGKAKGGVLTLRHLMHSLNVEYVQAPPDSGEEPDESLHEADICGDVSRMTDANITVRALLLVNKRAGSR